MHILDHLRFWSRFLIGRYPVCSTKITCNEMSRLDHYFQITGPFSLEPASVPVNSVSLFSKVGYAYDWYRMFRTNDRRRCHFLFGDVQFQTSEPTFCKSRPVYPGISNNVLLPLNTVRHYDFVVDDKPFEGKYAAGVWRGAAYKKLRKDFLIATQNIPEIDAQDTSDRRKNYLSKSAQLSFQLIFALEGNDVASNLKWVMGSNSAPVLTRPKFETWFCESQLTAGRHYIEIKDDFSDLEEKIDYHLSHPKLTKEIADESKHYASQFMDLERQFSLANEVIDRYFTFSA